MHCEGVDGFLQIQSNKNNTVLWIYVKLTYKKS